MLKLILSYLISASRKLLVENGVSVFNTLKTFPLFETQGWGLYGARAKLTVQSVNQVVPALAEFCSETQDARVFQELLLGFIGQDVSGGRLSSLFDEYGSDKASTHNYHLIYAGLLSEPGSVTKILEIGLGTNHRDVVSSMGRSGSPGASLRAFRDFCPSAEILGADVDRRILFSEERISTFWVDQTDTSSFSELGDQIGEQFDLMIDDGLHSPNANLHSLNFFLPRLKIGGYAVIEDINPLTEPLWTVVSALIADTHSSSFIMTKTSAMFVAMKRC